MLQPYPCYVAASDLRLCKQTEHGAVLSSLKTGQILTLPLLFLRSTIFSMLRDPQDLAKLDLRIPMDTYTHNIVSDKDPFASFSAPLSAMPSSQRWQLWLQTENWSKMDKKKHLDTQAQATDSRSESAAILFVCICVLISCLFAS